MMPKARRSENSVNAKGINREQNSKGQGINIQMVLALR